MTEQTTTPKSRQAQLEALYEASAQLGSSLDLPEVLNQVMDATIQLTGAERGFLMLYEESGKLQAEAAHNVDPHNIADQSLQISRTVIEQAVGSGNGILSNPAQENESDSSLRSMMCAPLCARDQVLGAVYVDSQGDFQEADLELLTTFANRAAVAIDNARLFTQTAVKNASLSQEITAAQQSKNEFISVVTHELRLPMTSIKGYTDLVLSGMVGELNEQQKQFMEVIKRNLGRMSVLISDLSDLNRLESGRLNFDMDTFDVRDVVADVVDSLQEQIAARGQTLQVVVESEVTAVYADPRRLKQVLTNLLSNAHQYTPEGGSIRIEVSQENGRAQVAVIDSGLGISDENQAQLFTQFFRAEDEAVRQQAGWGLGLSIAKNMVEAQGGEIWFKSALGEGSTFAFTIPSANTQIAE